MSIRADRRAFFTTLIGLGAATPLRGQGAATTWDLGWLDQFKGRHKQVFDFGGIDISEEVPLRLPNNYLNMFKEVYRAEPPEVNVAIGVARTAFPVNASDALWEKYKLGERWHVKDESGKPATKNIFLGSADKSGATIRSLAARGVVFWQCNVALGGITMQLANDTGVPFDKVRAELVQGLNPGVRIVPAHAMAIGLVQERGFTYMRP
jgi:intracellular sulfur oxidation DsrE/DsrF family protein